MDRTNFITMVDRPAEPWHRSPIIIRDLDHNFIIAEFETIEQLDFYANALGFTYTLKEEKEVEPCGRWKTYLTSHQIVKTGYFWKLSDLPADVKPIKALCNGSIVTCYFTNDGDRISIYRPNPNAKDVYRPMDLQDHLAHRRIYGSY